MVDVGFWGGMVPANSHNASELRAMLDAGALGFKSFFSPSGAEGLRAWPSPYPQRDSRSWLCGMPRRLGD